MRIKRRRIAQASKSSPPPSRRREAIETPANRPTSIEHFERWVLASVSMPAICEELHAANLRYEPEDLPAMIEIVREAEMFCIQRLQECGRRSRPEQETTDIGEWARTIELLVTHREVMEWNTRIKWLQEVRRHLEKKRQRSEVACAAA